MVVTGSPFVTRTDASGAFEIVDVPEGARELSFWSPGATPQRVELDDSGELRILWP